VSTAAVYPISSIVYYTELFIWVKQIIVISLFIIIVFVSSSSSILIIIYSVSRRAIWSGREIRRQSVAGDDDDGDGQPSAHDTRTSLVQRWRPMTDVGHEHWTRSGRPWAIVSAKLVARRPSSHHFIDLGCRKYTYSYSISVVVKLFFTAARES